ncbi:glycosyltransferase family 2 protein [Empedobacter brevis]|uniref:glycosyltransferase family 2 protein n=1 Tax=Empedobacter brevis TaxID=247 RepID=UPI0028A1B0C4|nr:glycosyltransferase family A protein [Empedobacter brevis]
MISIVIPLYNKALYIKETINNILNQTYQEFELIVVNDGSQDQGPEIVQSFNDSRIRLINKVNGGVSSARNVGIKEAKYDYIAFLDADDEWLPNHLEEINKLIANYGDEADVFVTNFARKYTDGRIIANRNNNEQQKGVIENYFKVVLKKAIIHTSCVCVSKRALDEIDGFDEQLSRGEDIDVWIKLARKYKIAYSPVVTEYYLQEAANNSKKKFDIKKSYTFYIDRNDFISKEDELFNNKMITRKYLSLCKELDFNNFFKLLKKQGIKL